MRIVIGFSLVIIVSGLVWLGYHIAQDVTDFTHGVQCVEPGCQKLYAAIKTVYDEGKDLSKSFLTLIVAVFVASITFSEKIIDLKTAGPWAKTAMIICWASLLLAIVACGTGLVYLASMLDQALFVNLPDDRHANTAATLIASSGMLFVIGLIMMLLAGMPAFLRKTA